MPRDVLRVVKKVKQVYGELNLGKAKHDEFVTIHVRLATTSFRLDVEVSDTPDEIGARISTVLGWPRQCFVLNLSPNRRIEAGMWVIIEVNDSYTAPDYLFGAGGP